MIGSMKDSLASVVCTVENGHGKDSISYSVEVVRPPVAPTIRVSKITTNTINLAWNLPHNGGALVQGQSVRSSFPSHAPVKTNYPPPTVLFTVNKTAQNP